MCLIVEWFRSFYVPTKHWPQTKGCCRWCWRNGWMAGQLFSDGTCEDCGR